MKIVMITGSPHKHGTAAALAAQFAQGAAAAGHTVVRFDTAFQKVHPCIACEQCHTTDKGCVFQDDMRSLDPELLAMADDTAASAEGAVATFRGMASYLGWELAGMVVAVACGDAQALEQTDYPRQAYEPGNTI